MRAFLMGAAALAGMTGIAQAQTFAGTGVDIRNAAAIVTIVPENRTDIAVQSSAGRADLPAISVSQEGGRVIIDGGLRNRLRGCGGIGVFMTGRMPVLIQGLGQVRAEDLPRITIRTPRTLDVTSRGSIYGDIAASNGGRLTVQGCGAYDVAAVSGDLELLAQGSGDTAVNRVDGALRATLEGSGDLRVGAVQGNADLMLQGSGDVEAANIGGMLTAVLQGSGDVDVGDVGGDAGLRLEGSGDVSVRNVRGGLSASLQGSGDVSAASTGGGRVQLTLDGSGDVSVDSGTASHLTARNQGSGNVSFGGRTDVLNATVEGSGNVSVAHAARVEQVVDRGSGEVDYN